MDGRAVWPGYAEAGTHLAPARYRRNIRRREPWAIPNDSVTENEIAEKRRQEAEEERKAARRRSPRKVA